MYLTVLDPGYSHSNSHHHAVNVELSTFLIEEGWTVRIIAGSHLHEVCKAELEQLGVLVEPYFSTPFYQECAQTLAPFEHQLLAAKFADELEYIFGESSWKDSTVLLHTGFSAHFKGLAKFFARGSSVTHIHLVLLTMFAPMSDSLCVAKRSLDWYRYRHSLCRLRFLSHLKKFRFTLAAPSAGFKKIYASMVDDVTVLIHPAVTYRAYKFGNLRTRQKRIVSYLGSPKEDKGIRFAAQFTLDVVKKFPQLEVVFQFNREFSEAALYEDILQSLSAAAIRYDNLVLLQRGLGRSEYDRLLGSSVAICLFHDPSEYSFKTSGILWDSLRVPGLRVMACRGTWLEGELFELGIEANFIEFGQIDEALSQLESIMSLSYTDATPVRNGEYFSQLMRPLGEWLCSLKMHIP